MEDVPTCWKTSSSCHWPGRGWRTCQAPAWGHMVGEVSITHDQGFLTSDSKTLHITDEFSDHVSLADFTDHFGYTLFSGYARWILCSV